ncbi:MAG: NAD(P)-dependent oxidoreductase [Polyangiaceae bacterium]|nr:NAD(P)-dependent oxidoreductase [Polyangiaceae bacterium]
MAVTGASGLLGRALARALAEHGVEVVPIARDATRLETGGLEARRAPPADAVVHLAFPTSAAERRRDPEATRQRVLGAARGAVALASALRARHVVLASTGKVYGADAAVPLADDVPARPTTELGRVKLAAEEQARAHARATGAALTVLRIFNAYGPGQAPGFFFPTLLSGLAAGRLVLGELDHGRDWVHARDVAAGFVTALGAPPPPGETRTLGLGTGRATTVREILALVRRLGHAVPEPVIDAERRREREAEVERTLATGLRALGWAPETSLEDGVAELLGQPSGSR